MKILKFGGTSVQTPERVKSVIEIIKQSHQQDQIAVVFSAFGGTTDQLIQMGRISSAGDDAYLTQLEQFESKIFEFAKSLIKAKNQSKVFASLKSTLNELEDILNGVYLVKEITPRTMDVIMSFGERISCYLIHEAMKEYSIDSEFLDTRNVVKTDENFGAARVHFQVTYENLKQHFKDHPALQVVTGFIASTMNNETTTLGRSGSDYTASILGAALEVGLIEIWTDVNGIMTADPRVVPAAFPLSNITYEEAMEMSHFGTKVIHPSSMQPAFEKNIPVLIKNTYHPGFEGTMISKDRKDLGHLISGISSIEKIALLRVQGAGMMGVTGISARLFSALAKADINIILITQASSEHTICFAVAPEDSYRAKETIEEEFSLEIEVHQIDRVIIEEDLTIVAAVGENMRHTPGIAGRLFQILGKNSINVVAIAQGSSELNISAVIAQEDEDRALNAMHAAFFKKRSKAINVFLVGTGRVGGALIKQMQDYITRSSDRKKYELNILGLANSRKMYFDQGGITESDWKDLLDQSDAPMELSQFIREMRAINLSNCVFVDCTSSNEIADGYAEILKAGISVVTANKKANSDRFEKYMLLRDLAESNELQYLYETNVCAGLPVIHTIQDLLNVGDTIYKIEAVVSGTLSYIFNSFSGDRKFSDIVIEAHEKGYTEPDPRDDLDGMDMVRKLLILARESGVPLELEQVENQKFLPEEFFNVDTVDDFIEQLKTYDSAMEEKRKQAEKDGKTLQYIASLAEGKAEIALKAIGESHPFYQLTGNDNIIALTTRLYNETPMVIQGPGAGPEVTAAGVFTDILQVGTQIFKNSEEGEV